MRTKDIKVGEDYAQASKEYQQANPERVRVLETNVSYEGVDHSSRRYRTKTKAGGVRVALVDDDGSIRVNRNESSIYWSGSAIEPGEPLVDVVRPATILHTWDQEQEYAAARAERRARAAEAQAQRDERIKEAKGKLMDVLEEGEHSVREHYTQGVGYTGFELTLTQVERLLEMILED